MKTKGKLLSLLLSLAVIFTFMPAMAFAESDEGSGDLTPSTVEYVAQIGDESYTTLRAAFDAAKSGATIKVIAKINADKFSDATDKRISISGGEFTLDLNGYEVSAGATKAISLYGTKLTIKDSSTGGNGVLKTNKSGNEGTGTVVLWNSTDSSSKGSEVILEGGTIENDAYAVFVGGFSTFTLTNGTVLSHNATAIQVDRNGDGAKVNVNGGTVKTENGQNAIQNFGKHTTINVTGGKLEAVNFGICSRNFTDPQTGKSYSSEGAEITVSGGTITANQAIEIQPGKLTVSGNDASPVLNGGISVGGKNAVCSATITGGDFKKGLLARNNGIYDISGGKFEGGFASMDADNKGVSNAERFEVTGGTFTSAVDIDDFAQSGSIVTVNPDGTKTLTLSNKEKALRAAAAEKEEAVKAAEEALEQAKETGNADEILKAAEALEAAANEYQKAAEKTGSVRHQTRAEAAVENAAAELKEAKNGKAGADLDSAKAAAVAELDKIDLAKYQEPELSNVKAAIAAAKAAIEKAGTPEAVKAALDGAKSAISAEAVYDANLPKVTAKKPAKAKKALTAKWKKLSKKNRKKVDGIEVWVAQDNGFTTALVIKTAGKSKASKKFKGLEKKKTYYVKARTYKTVNGVKYVGNWSKIKKVKTK
ncbi:MAG: hypothetical protein E7219_04930 [Clostridiales bacterium]|nr:hypothetical protein [Clostridiales bacterium]